MLNPSAYSVKLPVYAGPLDLLLQLIERAELDITVVALAQVTDQYLAHLRDMQDRDLGEIASFLVIAAKLVLIKSEAILPRPPALQPGEEEDEGEQLARQLREYKRFKAVAEGLMEREAAGLRSYLRLAPPPKVEPRLDLSNVGPMDLLLAMRHALAAVAQPPSLDASITAPKVTLRDRIGAIRRAMLPHGRVTFQEVLAGARSRMEIVVTFLAVLELIKRRRVTARQETPFGDILLLSDGTWENDEEGEATEFE